MFCPNCGKQLADGARFCPQCGSQVSAGPAAGGSPAGGTPAGAPVSPVTAPAPQQTPFNSGDLYTPVKTDRSLLAYILLTIVTCGIYGYWFVYSIAQDMNAMCREDGEKTGGLAAYIILSFVTCGLYNWYWQFKIANRLAANAPRYGLHFQEDGTAILLWDIIGLLLCGLGPLVAMHIIIKNTNALALAYNAHHGR